MEEDSPTDAIVIAATNHPELLDTTLARRFDDVIIYSMPDREAAETVIECHLDMSPTKQVVCSPDPIAALDARRAAKHVFREFGSRSYPPSRLRDARRTPQGN